MSGYGAAEREALYFLLEIEFLVCDVSLERVAGMIRLLYFVLAWGIQATREGPN